MSNYRNPTPFMTIHFDVWEPTQNISLSEHKSFITFIDCYSRLTWIYLLKAKSDVFLCFQLFHKIVCTQFDT